jgi:hypothetical protein
MDEKRGVHEQTKKWERGDNEKKNRKASASWQNDTVELSRKKQGFISRLRTGYTRATHRNMIEKTDIPVCAFYEEF